MAACCIIKHPSSSTQQPAAASARATGACHGCVPRVRLVSGGTVVARKKGRRGAASPVLREVGFIRSRSIREDAPLARAAHHAVQVCGSGAGDAGAHHWARDCVQQQGGSVGGWAHFVTRAGVFTPGLRKPRTRRLGGGQRTTRGVQWMTGSAALRQSTHTLAQPQRGHPPAQTVQAPVPSAHVAQGPVRSGHCVEAQQGRRWHALEGHRAGTGKPAAASAAQRVAPAALAAACKHEAARGGGQQRQRAGAEAAARRFIEKSSSPLTYSQVPSVDV